MISTIWSILAKIDPKEAGVVEVNFSTGQIVGNVSSVAFGIAAAVAVLFIIIGGISYTASAGDPGKISKAKDTILYAVIGLVVVLVSFVAIQFVIGRFK